MTRQTVANVQRQRTLSNWDAQQLSRFCEVAYQMARRQFSARLTMIPGMSDSRKEEFLKELMEETEIIAENLIILALDYGHVDAKKLKQKPVDQGRRIATRGLILTEEVD